MPDKAKHTIYDILPMLETEVLKLLTDFMKADDGAFYTWEIAIFLPASNAFIHYLSGVNASLKDDNYITAMANVRGLIESLGAVVYDGTVRLPKEAYDWFLENGRLPKRNAKNTKWIQLRPTEIVGYAQQAVDPKVNLREMYEACNDMIHFTSKHMSFLGGFNPQIDEGERIVQFKVGAKDNIPVKHQRELIDFCAILTNVFGECVRLAIKEKSQRLTSKP